MKNNNTGDIPFTRLIQISACKLVRTHTHTHLYIRILIILSTEKHLIAHRFFTCQIGVIIIIW